MSRQSEERERIRMLNALATVSSLGLMTVFDFMLAYIGGDWLDRHFNTGDHTFRMACICLAILTMFLTFFKLVYGLMQKKDGGD